MNLSEIKTKSISDLIDIVTEDLEKSKFINDKFYSESKAKSLIQRGSSINKIRNYLINKGIGEKYIKNTIDLIKINNEDQDFFSAIKYVKRKELAQTETRQIEGFFIKKIFQYLQDLVLATKYQKKF